MTEGSGAGVSGAMRRPVGPQAHRLVVRVPGERPGRWVAEPVAPLRRAQRDRMCRRSTQRSRPTRPARATEPSARAPPSQKQNRRPRPGQARRDDALLVPFRQGSGPVIVPSTIGRPAMPADQPPGRSSAAQTFSTLTSVGHTPPATPRAARHPPGRDPARRRRAGPQEVARGEGVLRQTPRRRGRGRGATAHGTRVIAGGDRSGVAKRLPRERPSRATLFRRQRRQRASDQRRRRGLAQRTVIIVIAASAALHQAGGDRRTTRHWPTRVAR